MERNGIRLAFLGATTVAFLSIVTSLVPYEQRATVVQTLSDAGAVQESTTSATTTNATTTAIIPAEPTPGVVLQQDAFKKCPLVPGASSANAFIVDFTQNGSRSVRELTIIANGTTAESERLLRLETVIPPGTYKVSLAGYDDHSTAVRWYKQDSEQWYLELFDTAGNILFTSPNMRDIGDSESLVTELVSSSAAIHGLVAKARAKHSVRDVNSTQELAPLCALFERIDTLYTQTVPTSNTQSSTTVQTSQTEIPQTSVIKQEPVKEVVTQEPEPKASEFISCPFPRRNTRTIVDFTHNGTVPIRTLSIVANKTRLDAVKGPYPVRIPAGEYTVRLASYGSGLNVVPAAHQEWYALLFDSAGKMIVKTPPSRDVPDGTTEFVSKVSDRFVIDRDVAVVSAMHARYPSDVASAHGVLCLAFDRIEAVSTTLEPEEKVIPMNTPVTDVAPVVPVVESAPPALQPAGTPVVVPKGVTQIKKDTTSPETHVPINVESERQESIFTQLNKGGADERVLAVTSIVSDAGLSLPARIVVEDSAYATSSDILLTEQQKNFKMRDEAGIMRDTDGDGVSDYDEVYFYDTDPNNPATAGGLLTDGERVLLGLDPLGKQYEVVPVESPKVVHMEKEDRFKIFNIEYASSSDAAGTSTAGYRSVRVEGFATPFSFVTLYVFSTPIVVTVRADEVGLFTYEFDEVVEDGSHEVYVTTVNRSGRIIAKSQPFAFTKTAEAIEYTAPMVSYDPVDDAARNMVVIVFVLIGIFGTAGLVLLGFWRSRHIDIKEL